MSTTPFSLLAWSGVLLIVTRGLRTGDDRYWVAAGAVAGFGFLDHTLMALLLAALLVGILISGPRRILASRWLWLGALIAFVFWLPYLIWQAQNGWPQLELGRAIAAGDSGSSQPRALFVPFQLVLISPYLAPIWIAGILRLFRDPALRWCRALAWTYPILAVAFIATGGKPYYLAGVYPLLLAVGAQPTIDWLHRGRTRLRQVLLIGAFVLAIPALVVSLPVLPVDLLQETFIVDVNHDAGETIGWPTYVRQIAAAYHDQSRSTPPPTAIITGNYGEAGAIDHFGPDLGLPKAYSGHLGYWYWGPPPVSATSVLAVGLPRSFLEQHFSEVHLIRRLHNHVDVDNDEQGVPIWICSGLSQPWSVAWSSFRHI